jgi:DNA-binding MarR family transcriptional regulator/N-acetylglutamate synthase-like GNAT family acetyltransferase
MDESRSDPRVAAVRRFNRFFTRRIGVLREGLLDTPFSLTEARVLYELAHRAAPTAAELGRALELDPGYLSRILRGFAAQGLVAREPSPGDARQRRLRLTEAGRAAFAPLDRRSEAEIGAMLAPLAAPGQARLVAAMATIERLLGGAPERPSPCLLRPPRPGDIGWVIARHGAIYAEEYGWDARFEGLVAEIAAKFVQSHDPRREHCWVAEQDGANVGAVFLVAQTERVAQLRLLIVEPEARGQGIGARLVEECVRFAREAQYRKVTLWTNSVLLAARRLYEAAGFQLVKSEPHRSFGQDLVGETWELVLIEAG